MRVFIILASIALAHGAKLERTYLPPSHAGTSGGSGNFLQTPVSGPSNFQNLPNGFEGGNGLSQNNGFPQNSGFAQNTGFPQSNGYQSSDESSENNLNGFNDFESRPERAQAALERSAAILRQDNSNDGETYAYAFETENGIYAEENGVATNGVEAQGGYSYTGDDGQVYSVRYTADQNGFVPQGDHLPTPPPIPEEIQKALEQNARDEAAGIYDDGSYSDGKYGDSDQQGYQNSFNGYGDSVVTNSAFQNYPAADSSRGNAGPGSAIEKTYLPPFALGSTGEVGPSGFNGLPNGASGSSAAEIEKTYLPPFATQGSGSAGFSRPNGSTGSSAAGVEKTYLPPFASQGAAGNSNDMRGPGSVQKNYLPPFAQGSGSSSGIRGSPQRAYVPPFASTQGSSGFRAPGSVKKTYLPPSSAARGNSFGKRQQSFDSRNGYQY